MQDIIAPIDRELLLKELNEDRFVRKANNGNNHIYIISHHDSPNVMSEVGRLREHTFRSAGGGTGKSTDIDEFDMNDNPYKQLIVWNPEDQEIVGGYRYILCNDVIKEDGSIDLATTELFSFSEKFVKEYLPYTIELGRSFVQPKYQPSSSNRKGLFSLDNLWDGLGALIVNNPEMKYYFGKVTMYNSFNPEARDLILFFMRYYFPDNESLMKATHPLGYKTDKYKNFGSLFEGLAYKEGHKVLNQHVRSLGENIPPLVNTYMNISATMKTFDTSANPHFGDVEETGILVTIADIFETKKQRHIDSYIND